MLNRMCRGLWGKGDYFSEIFFDQPRSRRVDFSPSSSAIFICHSSEPKCSLYMKYQGPVVREVYKNYLPPADVAKSISILLRYVPPVYLSGLSEIVLTNTGSLSRTRRREKTASGSPTPEVGGLYRQQWKGQSARIEIFVDNVLRGWPKLIIKIPFFRNITLADVLYHEIAHHIQSTLKPERSDREDFARKWELKLSRAFILKRYWYLQPFISLATVFAKLLMKAMKIVRKSGAGSQGSY